MAQKQGSSSSEGGRIDAGLGTAVAAANFALGVGWGTTATVSAVAAGSNDQAGIFTVSSAGTGQAQATATVTLTFVDGAYAATPRAAVCQLVNNSHAITETGPTAVAASTTALSFVHSVLPVAANTYQYSYIVIG
jgi:hypothetical protein